MDIFQSVWTAGLSFIILLTIVVFVHEMGHFLVGRWNGVRVEVFSIGFGRELFGFNDKHGTRWRVSMLPLGGYVKFFGDLDAASATGADESSFSDADRKVAFPCKSLWQKASIVFAGPAANFVFAALVFAVIFVVMGRPVTPAVVGEVYPNSAASEAGLQPGDRITAVEGNSVQHFEDVQRLVMLYGMQPMSVTVQRGDQSLTMLTHPHLVDDKGEKLPAPRLGIAISRDAIDIERLGPVEALGAAVTHTWDITRMTVVSLGQMISGQRGTEDIGGPIRIAEFSGQAARDGILSFVMLIAVLSINLGLINLVPVPILDGGHLALYAIEGLRGRPLGERAQDIGAQLGFVLVIGLMIFATWNDILRLVSG